MQHTPVVDVDRHVHRAVRLVHQQVLEVVRPLQQQLLVLAVQQLRLAKRIRVDPVAATLRRLVVVAHRRLCRRARRAAARRRRCRCRLRLRRPVAHCTDVLRRALIGHCGVV